MSAALIAFNFGTSIVGHGNSKIAMGSISFGSVPKASARTVFNADLIALLDWGAERELI
jgi:hypothetical protein